MLKIGHARMSLSGIQWVEKIVFSLRVCVRRVLVIPVAAQRNTGIPCFKQGDPGIFSKKTSKKTGMTTHGDIYRTCLKPAERTNF